MIRALIVDDEPPARQRLRQLLVEAEDVLVVAESGHADEARTAIERTRPDVVFLDIEMPETTGTAFAASLPDPRPFIVFATAYDRYALDAFALDATDYLVKPITRARLAATLDRVRARTSGRSDAERDIRAASALQATLMPRALPVIGGVDAAARTVQARGVGGDFYDALPRPNGATAFVLSDISGKGVPAGLVASSIQARLQAGAASALTPAELVARVSADLVAGAETGRYATLIYAELGPQRPQMTQMTQMTQRAQTPRMAQTTQGLELRVVNAGHPAALLLDPSTGRVERLAATGPVIGLLPGATFTEHCVALDPGAIFVAVSDGVLEAFDTAGREFGEDALVAALVEAAGRPAAGIIDVILDGVRRHRGTAAVHDDVTALVLVREQGGAS